MKLSQIRMFFLGVLVFLSGCNNEVTPKPVEQKSIDAPEAAPLEVTEEMSVEELRTKLKANQYAQFRKENGQFVFADLQSSGVTDLSPLKGMPLKDLLLENLQIKDLSPLKGMKLNQLYLNDTAVEDFSPLAEVQVSLLNLNHTKIKDLSALKSMELNTLWIPHTKVEDLSPLKEIKLVSLDCEDTPVKDLSPLAEMASLERLNIGSTEVTDLTPLAKLNLNRLIFNADKITKGLEVAREMKSIQEIGYNLTEKMAPEQFWPIFDAKQKETSKPAGEEKTKAEEKPAGENK